jgi:hypothetical protein
MRIVTLFLASIFVSMVGAQTPIVLSNNNMPSANDTLRYTTVNLNSVSNYSATGTNYNWNFSSVNSTTSGIRSFKSAIQTPYALFFLSFTGFAEKLPDISLGGTFSFTDYYNFYKKQTSPQAYIADGVGLTFSGVPLPSYFTDKDELYMFPMTYPKYDSTTFRFSTPSVSVVPIIYIKSGYRVTRVDGWGTVTTPYGTENCLRLITTQYAKDTIKTAFLPLGFPNTVRSYQWMTLNSKIPYFEVTGNVVGTNFVPTEARYRGYAVKAVEPPNTTGVRDALADVQQVVVYPNPVSEVLHLGAVPEDLIVSLHDSQGKFLRTVSLKSGAKTQDIEVTDLAPGIYSLNGVLEAKVFQIKFVKEAGH